MYGVWLGRLPSVSNLPNAANQFALADSRVGADVGVVKVGREESGDETFEFESG